jgi:acyl dehydratase
MGTNAAPRLHYEDVAPGSEIPPLVKRPTTDQLVRWQGVTGDVQRVHYDAEFARSIGWPGPIVHGSLKLQFLVQMLADWIGEDGEIRRLSCRYRGMDLPGDVLTCRGRVLERFVADDRHCLECEIYVENEEGERTTVGTAVVAVPSRGKSTDPEPHARGADRPSDSAKQRACDPRRRP